MPGAVHVPRGQLESRIEGLVPDRDARARRLLRRRLALRVRRRRRCRSSATSTSSRSPAASPTGSGTAIPVETPRSLTPEQRRALLAPPADPRGRRGRPGEAARRARAPDRRGRPRLARLALPRRRRRRHARHRRRRHRSTTRTCSARSSTRPTRSASRRSLSAKRTIEALNPDVTVKTYEERLTSENVERIFGDGWDVIVDGADNFPTRYLVNDASVWHDIPVVHGSIYRFEGQVTVFNPHDGPCYRCLFPAPPPPELAPSCAEGGVLGVLPGIVGSLQANEALKLVLGDRRHAPGPARCSSTRSATTVDEVAVQRDPGCPVCGDAPTITEYVDYVEFCARGGARDEGADPPDARATRSAASARSTAQGDTVREVLEDLSSALPGARAPALRGRRPRPVRERLRRRRGRAHARRPRHARERRVDDPPARHGRRVLSTTESLLDLVGNTPLVELSRFAPGPRARLREARGAEPDRLDQGPRRKGDDRGRPRPPASSSPAGGCSSRRAATPGSRSRSSRSSRATRSPA